jgi:hypothetical protein
MFRRLLVTLMVLFPALGCMQEADENELSALESALRARVHQHRDAAGHWMEVEAARGESGHYAGDMRELMGRMRGTCHGMMGSMGSAEAAEPEGGLLEEMGRRVDHHRARMGELEDLDAMRAQCEAHHEEMLGLLDAMAGVVVPHGHHQGGHHGGMHRGMHDGAMACDGLMGRMGDHHR